MEERVNNNDIGIQTINPGRKNQVEPKAMGPAIPRAANGIQEKPAQKLPQMGTGEGRDFMPDDGSGVF
jgi:hypothetical protein